MFRVRKVYILCVGYHCGHDDGYPFDGQPPEGFDSVVDKPRYENGRFYINGKGDEGQYFDAVPPVAWDFPIGGYPPLEKGRRRPDRLPAHSARLSLA